MKTKFLAIAIENIKPGQVVEVTTPRAGPGRPVVSSYKSPATGKNMFCDPLGPFGFGTAEKKAYEKGKVDGGCAGCDPELKTSVVMPDGSEIPIDVFQPKNLTDMAKEKYWIAKARYWRAKMEYDFPKLQTQKRSV